MKRGNKNFIALLISGLMATSILSGCGQKKVEGTNLPKDVSEKIITLEGELAKDEFLSKVDIERACKHIDHLSNEIGVRFSGKEGEIKAAEYIKSQFEEMGYDAEIKGFEYEGFTGKGNSNNVVATRKPSGEDKEDTDEIVYVTAHYDSVRKSPGANDNASGVAAILEIANVIKDLDIDKEIRFIAFGSEEIGLIGSGAYVEGLSQEELSKSVACFNLDMVATAYDKATDLAVYTADGEENIVTDAVRKSGEELKELSTKEINYEGEFDSKTKSGDPMPVDASDHAQFTFAGIPAALFINIDPSVEDLYGQLEPYYHTPSDNRDNFSPARLQRSINLVGKSIYDVVDVNH